jgi:hypothetical protein
MLMNMGNMMEGKTVKKSCLVLIGRSVDEGSVPAPPVTVSLSGNVGESAPARAFHQT